ncbi:MAG TPA: sulfite exporter TauE/SafE family protein, partial [Gammaproteobacteria bacterium]|nr:sulfite exporter TauE/SafE family protein [Gammaproteobacteria bacterium]
GLIYSVLIWALSTGSPSQGGLLMLSFAAGTLPNLLLMGVFAARMGVYLRRAGVRQLAGAVVIGLGLWQFGLALILAANM